MSSSRKKQRVAAAGDARSPSATNAGAMQITEGLTFTPLADLSQPSATYLSQMKQLVELKRGVSEELISIAESAKRGSRGGDGNVWETPGKRALSAQTELARMDFMESASVAPLLYRESHFTAGEAEDRAALHATDEWREVAHVMALYEELRRNLVVRSARRSKVRSILMLALVFVYTMMVVPLFALTIVIAPLNPIWTAMGVRNHFYPVDLVQKFYARGFLFLCGVRVYWHGMEHIDYTTSTIGMFSHASNLDPFIVASGPLAFKWIGKKSLFKIPVIGWLLTGFQHIAIERENREKAIASLQRAAEIVRKHRRCIAVSPEGTRSKSGRIQDFKKGAFHTAMQLRVPVTPLLVDGAYDLWPSGAIFTLPGTVHVHVLQPLPISPQDDYNSLASKVRRKFLEANLRTAREAAKALTTAGRNSKAAAEKNVEKWNFLVWSLWLPICYAVLYLIYCAAISAIKAVV